MKTLLWVPAVSHDDVDGDGTEERKGVCSQRREEMHRSRLQKEERDRGN